MLVLKPCAETLRAGYSTHEGFWDSVSLSLVVLGTGVGLLSLAPIPLPIMLCLAFCVSTQQVLTEYLLPQQLTGAPLRRRNTEAQPHGGIGTCSRTSSPG